MKRKKKVNSKNISLFSNYILYVVIVLLILAILGLGVYSFTGDAIRGIRPGTFAAGGDYKFPDSVFVLGKIGIGTGNPYAPLHIKGGFTQQILERDDNSQQWSFLIQANKDLSLRDQNKLETLFDFTKDGNFIVRNGRVGIGTSTPSNALDVVGNIRASGNIIADSIDADYVILRGYSNSRDMNKHDCSSQDEGAIKMFYINTTYSNVKTGEVCFCLGLPDQQAEDKGSKEVYHWRCLLPD